MKKPVLWFLTLFICMNSSAQKFEQLAKTPPMGWNSWDCFGMDVTEEQVRSTADYMAKHMKSSGWIYVVVDMGWYYGEGLNTSNFRMRNPPQFIDEYGRVIPNIRKFPSAANGQGLKPLSDYVHGLGLKFGIHIMRGIPRQSVDKNTLVKNTLFRAENIASYTDTCAWYHGMLGVDMTKPGSREYYESLIELYTEWGVDYIKADNMTNPYYTSEIEALSNAIKRSGRPIVLSLSAGPVPVSETDNLRKNAHIWRISGDMWDDWSFVKEQFEICREWQNNIIPHHWPDCDILPLGKLRINGTDGMLADRITLPHEKTINEYSRLTNDEIVSTLTLWIIFRSPLMMGGNLLENDSMTLQLLTNKEALVVNQKSTNNHELKSDNSEIVWIADDPASHAKYVAIFNIGDDRPRHINVTWKELGLSGEYAVRDLWKKADAGNYKDNFEATINPHSAGLYKLSKK